MASPQFLWELFWASYVALFPLKFKSDSFYSQIPNSSSVVELSHRCTLSFAKPEDHLYVVVTG